MAYTPNIKKSSCSCCSHREQGVETQAHKEHSKHTHTHNHSHHQTDEGNGTFPLKAFLPGILSFAMLVSGIVLDHTAVVGFFSGGFRLGWYLMAYLIVAAPVFIEGWESIIHKDVFNEFTLMSVATIGAFCIGEYPEGVAVMLFYAVGELFQDSAVSRAQKSIKALLDIKPETATVKRGDGYQTVAPTDVKVGDMVQVKAGERVPLDCRMISPDSSFDTQALTGESTPSVIRSGENVLAGMINLEKVIEVEVTKEFTDSTISRILDMVQNATARKARTELMITKFARIYTPMVFFLALAITLIPALFVADYVFRDWLYRGLIFLVVSCPCALVISIPLGYFGGIGAASRHGILFKGANFLDTLCKVNTVVFDKTGTLTKGVFNVQEVKTSDSSEKEFLSYVKSLEQNSTHPIAKAVMKYGDGSYLLNTVAEVREVAGQGLTGVVNGKLAAAGNGKLMRALRIDYPQEIDTIPETTILAAIDNKFAGYIVIADEIKEDAVEAIQNLEKQGIEKTVMLSGDKQGITEVVARKLRINEAYGDLLPEQKVNEMDKIKADKNNVVAFVGDGINDTPVLALSDVGIAMGGMGSDAAIETADVIIQTDHPSKIALAICISKATRVIVMQNIVLALGVKLIVMVMGGFGVANMWEAVFADVGVALLAILNAVRILNKKF
ncbi:MAG: heavy metal translocating P-type ATPase [Dysgonamonadaceae bacterium]